MRMDHFVALSIKRTAVAMTAVLMMSLFSGCAQRDEPDGPRETTVGTMTEEVSGSSAPFSEPETTATSETETGDASLSIVTSVPDELTFVDFAIDKTKALLLLQNNSGSQVLRECADNGQVTETDLKDYGVTASFVAAVNGLTVLADRPSCRIWVLDDGKLLFEDDLHVSALGYETHEINGLVCEDNVLCVMAHRDRDGKDLRLYYECSNEGTLILDPKRTEGGLLQEENMSTGLVFSVFCSPVLNDRFLPVKKQSGSWYGVFQVEEGIWLTRIDPSLANETAQEHIFGGDVYGFEGRTLPSDAETKALSDCRELIPYGWSIDWETYREPGSLVPGKDVQETLENWYAAWLFSEKWSFFDRVSGDVVRDWSERYAKLRLSWNGFTEYRTLLYNPLEVAAVFPGSGNKFIKTVYCSDEACVLKVVAAGYEHYVELIRRDAQWYIETDVGRSEQNALYSPDDSDVIIRLFEKYGLVPDEKYLWQE